MLGFLASDRVSAYFRCLARQGCRQGMHRQSKAMAHTGVCNVVNSVASASWMTVGLRLRIPIYAHVLPVVTSCHSTYRALHGAETKQMCQLRYSQDLNLENAGTLRIDMQRSVSQHDPLNYTTGLLIVCSAQLGCQHCICDNRCMVRLL